jgi:hypothetical protein
MFGGEDLFAARGVARSIEKADGVKVREQIGRRFGAERRASYVSFLHCLPHGWSVIPHQPSQIGRCKVAVYDLAQIRADSATLSVDTVTLDALLGLEEIFAAGGIAGYVNGRVGAQCGQACEYCYLKNPHI